MIEADKKGHKNKGCKHYLTWRTILHFMDVSEHGWRGVGRDL